MIRLVPRGRQPLQSAALVLALMLPAATTALAHAELKSSAPAANATVDATIASLRITFSEAIELAFSGATLTGPGDSPVKTGPATLDATDHATLIVPLLGTLAGGKYAVSWHNLSSDGHKLKGNFSFAVKP